MTLTLGKIAELLSCQIIIGESIMDKKVENCFCADLMSDVLAYAQPNSVLLTGLANAQSVRTADVADFFAVIFLRGKQPNQASIECAKQSNIALLTTKHNTIDACGILYTQGISNGKEK